MKKEVHFHMSKSVSLQNEGIRQIPKLVELSFLFLFLIVFSPFAKAEVTFSPSNLITLNQENKTVGQVLKSIEGQSGYGFFYNNKQIDLNRRVSVSTENADIFHVLDKVFAGTDVHYTVRDKQIILTTLQEGKKAVVNDETFVIQGTVKDAKGQPIIGATVLEKGTNNGTATDENGHFTLTTQTKDAELDISYIGYQSQQIKAVAGHSANVQLHEDIEALKEVVVIGYGTQKKGEVASAIGTVKSEDFIKLPVADAAQLIKGKIAGLSIISPDGNPTSVSQIALRGNSTLKSSTSPLILIDGIPGSLNTVSPDDIDQIDVLKDGSAAAIYGTRGSNGVILITTKKGSSGKAQVNFNVYLSTQSISKKLDFMSPSEYREMVKQGKSGAIDGGDNVDWLDEVTRTPFSQVYNLSLKGGNSSTNYIASFEYRDQKGLMKRSNNKFMYPRIEVNHWMFGNKLKINASLSGYKQEYFSGSEGTSYNNDIYRNALSYNPTTPIKDANGNWSENTAITYYQNPLALLNEVDGKNEASNLRMFSTITYNPIEDLSIKLLLSSNTNNLTQGYYETKHNISTLLSSYEGYAMRGSVKDVEDLCELTAQYNLNIAENHHFTFLAGYSWLTHNYQSFSMRNLEFPSDLYSYNDMSQGAGLKDGKAKEFSYQSQNRLIGYFGRLNYNYKERYMLSASVRHEGSSKFGENNKWGTFPAVSAAWNLKGESFLTDNDIISLCKLRAGYGITGTEPTNPYMSLNTLSFGYYSYYDGDWVKTIRSNSNSNPDLRWEKKEEVNIGLDFGFLDNRISATVDLYRRKTKDLLWDYTVPTPPFMYGTMTANAGKMENKGIEASFTAIPVQTKDFSWTTSVNYSTNKNKLLSLSNDQFKSTGYAEVGYTGEPISQITHRIQEGKSIGNFYGYKSIDIDENGHWIIEGEDGNPKSIKDQQPTDKKIIGNGLPKHYLNWNNTISYKNFDLSIYMRGAFGFDILNMARMQYGAPIMLTRGNIFKNSLEKKYGKVALADDQSLQYVSYYIEKGDYWKIDNITLGYTFNFNKNYIQKIRLYGTVGNLAVITGYTGIDPEVNIIGLAPGVDDKTRYPATRTFTFGASVTF